MHYNIVYSDIKSQEEFFKAFLRFSDLLIREINEGFEF